MKPLKASLAGMALVAMLSMGGCSSYSSYSGIYTSVDETGGWPQIARLELQVSKDGTCKGSMVLLRYDPTTAMLGFKRVETESLPVQGNIDKSRIHLVIGGPAQQAAEGSVTANTIEMTVPVKGTFTRSTQAEYQAFVKKAFGKNAPNV